jgi:hypothetical protein
MQATNPEMCSIALPRIGRVPVITSSLEQHVRGKAGPPRERDCDRARLPHLADVFGSRSSSQRSTPSCIRSQLSGV